MRLSVCGRQGQGIPEDRRRLTSSMPKSKADLALLPGMFLAFFRGSNNGESVGFALIITHALYALRQKCSCPSSIHQSAEVNIVRVPDGNPKQLQYWKYHDGHPTDETRPGISTPRFGIFRVPGATLSVAWQCCLSVSMLLQTSQKHRSIHLSIRTGSVSGGTA